MNTLVKALAVVCSAAVLWGCSTTGTELGDGEGTGAATGDQVASMDNSAEVRPVGDGGSFVGNPIDDPSSLLSQRVVYFDFDRAEIKGEARQIIEAHAQYLSQNPGVRISIEGHCDERGTREYNLSLGERRAKAVQQMMVLLGVSSNQLELVSYGEERPVALGHDEDAWALNRRAEFIYPN